MEKFKNGYYIFSDFNSCLSDLEIAECVNESIDVEKIRSERNNLFIKTYEFLGAEDFMKLVHMLGSGYCALAYFTGDIKKLENREECDCHHCCECWEKQIRELIEKG